MEAEITRLQAALAQEKEKTVPKPMVYSKSVLDQCTCTECCELDAAGNVIEGLLPHPITGVPTWQRKQGVVQHWWCYGCKKGPWRYDKVKPKKWLAERTANTKVMIRRDFCAICGREEG